LDTILSRASAGVVQIGTTAANALGSLNLTNLTSTGLLSSTNASTSLLSVFQKAYFGGTATSTFDSTGFLTLVNGFNSQASSTIGAGGQTTGLTISGGATTTGNQYIAGTLGVGAQSNVASAVVQIDSTTKGFLPPRLSVIGKVLLHGNLQAAYPRKARRYGPW